MDKEYILPKLITWAKLFYGKDKKCFAKKRGEVFVFGWKNKKMVCSNIITKEVAIYLSLHESPKPEISEEEVLKAFKKFLKKQTPYNREKVIHKFSKFVKKKKK